MKNILNKQIDFKKILNTIKTYFLIYIKSIGIFISTFLIIYFITIGTMKLDAYLESKKAISKIPDPELKRELIMVTAPVSYERVVQTWFVPEYQKWISPISWLKYTENCIFCARLNAMKFSGMIQEDLDINGFIKSINLPNFEYRWNLHHSKYPLTEITLNEIQEHLSPESKDKYYWYSINDINELIYLAKKNHHVMIYTQIWYGPSRKYPKPVKYRNINFALACTVTGVKSYDPVEDVIEFKIYETLPFSELTLTPVYSKLTKSGCNIFDRQSIPFIVKWGEKFRSGYILKKEKKKIVKI